MPLIAYNPEKLTHPLFKNTGLNHVAPFSAGELIFPVAGPQVIPKVVWNKAIKSEEYGGKLNDYLDRQVLEYLADDDHPSLKDDTPVNAVKLVRDCYDLELLNQWRDDETRPAVVKALDAQIKQLTPPPESAKKEKT